MYGHAHLLLAENQCTRCRQKPGVFTSDENGARLCGSCIRPEVERASLPASQVPEVTNPQPVA